MKFKNLKLLKNGVYVIKLFRYSTHAQFRSCIFSFDHVTAPNPYKAIATSLFEKKYDIFITRQNKLRFWSPETKLGNLGIVS